MKFHLNAIILDEASMVALSPAIAQEREDVVIMTRREIADHALHAPADWFA